MLFVCSLCVALAVFVSWARGVYRTDAAMTLQLYVTVVPCFQTGWIETTGLKKSLGTDGRRVGLARNPPASTSLQALLLLLVLLLVMVVVVEVTVV